MSVLNWILAAAGIGIMTFLAYGGLIGAVVAYGARFNPKVPRFVSEAATIACVAISVWFFSALHHDREKDLERLRAVIAEQARQRESAERVAERAHEKAVARTQEVEELQELVDDYEDALAAGSVAACPSDPDYLRRMQSIDILKQGAAPKGRN